MKSIKLISGYFSFFKGITPAERRHIVSIILDGTSEVLLGIIFPELKELSLFSLLGLSLIAWGFWHYLVCRFEKWMKKEIKWIDLSN